MTDERGRPKGLLHNWLSVLGVITSIVSLAATLCLIVIDLLSRELNPYVSAVAYVFLPSVLIFGIVLIVYGAWHERSARAKRGFVREFPLIDFNNPKHQRWAYLIIGLATSFILLSMFGAYKAYEFSESTEFCGKMCHVVMEPEHTAYHNSPHARVDCVQCHIGPGADWFVRSKISGAYQIYSVIAKKYSKPIGTPVKNLRPAQETCEQCHWPEKFYGAVEQDHQYFLEDESNTMWRNRMLLHVGGGDPELGQAGGIHWHMNINNKVDYVASDEKRQAIPWVKVTRKDGSQEVFIDKSSKFKSFDQPSGELRRMDCIDCHNRPSHIYHAPNQSVNKAMATNLISRSLPYIKKQSVKALTVDYATTEEAAAKIRESIEKYYQENYPEVWGGKKDEINRSIDAVIQIYRNNFFPHMKVNWKAYPNNIGHMVDSGCFRCHDGKHESQSGKIITNDCNVCHTIVAQGTADSIESSINGLPFKHPNDTEDAWKEMSCNECHSGGLNT